MPFYYATKKGDVAQRREVERKFRQEENRVVDLKRRVDELQKEMLTSGKNLDANDLQKEMLTAERNLNANDLQKEMLTAERNLNALRAIIQKYETLVKDSIEHQRQLIRYINPN